MPVGNLNILINAYFTRWSEITCGCW